MAIPKNALVVDDDETLRLVAKRHLAKIGFTVQMAATGKEAVDACKLADFDLIFMDIQMPELDGYEATLEIRKLEQTKPRPKSVIIAMTASQDPERVAKSGMNDYLFKPFLFDNMKRIVGKHFPAITNHPD